MKTKSLCMALALLCLACNKNETSTLDTEIKNMEMCVSMEPPACRAVPKDMVNYAPVIKDEAPGDPANDKNKITKIIKDGYLSIKVEDVASSKRYMDSTIKKFGAYYESENSRNMEDINYYNLHIRVPSKRFEALLKATEGGEGEIMEKNINTRDVTEDYYDSEIRLNSKRQFRNRYHELLTKAIKVEDMLSIEENLRVVQEEIESQEGHLKFIDDQVLYSTLTVHLYHDKEIKEEKKEETFGERITNSVGNGWESVIRFVLWTITQWPWFIVATLSFLMIRRIVKRRRKLSV